MRFRSFFFFSVLVSHLRAACPDLLTPLLTSERDVERRLLPLGLLHSGWAGPGRGQPAGGRREGIVLYCIVLYCITNVGVRIGSLFLKSSTTSRGAFVWQPVSESGAVASVVSDRPGGEGWGTSRPPAARTRSLRMR